MPPKYTVMQNLPPSKIRKIWYSFLCHGESQVLLFRLLFDNRAGNQTGILGPTEYHQLFHNLRTPYYKVLEGHEAIKDSASELWILMMGHQTKLLRQNPERK